jgi:hypothetical protein
MQQRLFSAALDELAEIGEPVNRVIDYHVSAKRQPRPYSQIKRAVQKDSPLPFHPWSR